MQTLRVINSVNKNLGFRSLQEVDRAIDLMRTDLNSIENTLEIITAATSVSIVSRGDKNTPRPSKRKPGVGLLDGPSEAVLKQNTALVTKLHGQLQSVDGWIAEMSFKFKNDRGHETTMKELKKLRADVAKQIKVTYTAINKVANGQMPASLRLYVKQFTDGVLEKIEGLYDEAATRLFVDTENGNLRFTYYLSLENFQDSDGRTIPDYNVVLTNVIGERLDQKFVTTLLNFFVPGRFGRGKDVGGYQEALRVVFQAMRSEGYRHIVYGDPLPLADSDVDKDKFKNLARDVKINPDSIVFTFKAGVAKPAAIQELFLLVKGLFSSVFNAKVIPKYSVSGEKITFYANNEKPIKLNRVELKRMQTDLGLSDEEVIRVQQVI